MNSNQKRLFLIKNKDQTTTWLATQLGMSTRQIREHKAYIRENKITEKKLESEMVEE